VVGESGSGKTTLLNCISPGSSRRRQRRVPHARRPVARCLPLSEAERRFLMRTDWGFVHQNPPTGLRMTVSAGANVGERLMAVGDRHYGKHPRSGARLAGRVEIAETASTTSRAPSPAACASACRSPATSSPAALVFMDEPTGGLDVSVQARLLDLLRGLVADLGLAAIVVTHDLAVARLLSHRMMVMKDGR
jgi:putative phosphonate transport system ATP-binding protein